MPGTTFCSCDLIVLLIKKKKNHHSKFAPNSATLITHVPQLRFHRVFLLFGEATRGGDYPVSLLIPTLQRSFTLKVFILNGPFTSLTGLTWADSAEKEFALVAHLPLPPRWEVSLPLRSRGRPGTRRPVFCDLKSRASARLPDFTPEFPTRVSILLCSGCSHLRPGCSQRRPCGSLIQPPF